MGVISAKKLNEALTRAKGVGIVEDTFTIGDCEIVLQNLRPDQYEAALGECKDIEDLEYIHAFQMAHVCRAIVELNGVSLREVTFVECEEVDPKKGGTRTVKREAHEWLRQEVLSTWGKESIFVAYRKFSDVVLMAENKAKEGIVFLTPDEIPEDKYRRLLGDLKEVEAEVPPALRDTVLKENGYAPYTAPQDLVTMEDMERRMAEATTTEAAAPVEPTPVAPAAEEPSLRRRVPLNQQAVSIPTPPPAAHVPDAVASKFTADPFVEQVPPITHPKPEVAEVLPKHDYVDPTELSKLVEPPKLGLNPKFRPPR